MNPMVSNYTLQQWMEVCDWLMMEGFCLRECARIMANIELGDTLSLSLLREYKNRDEKGEQNAEIFEQLMDDGDDIMCDEL